MHVYCAAALPNNNGVVRAQELVSLPRSPIASVSPVRRTWTTGN